MWLNWVQLVKLHLRYSGCTSIYYKCRLMTKETQNPLIIVGRWSEHNVATCKWEGDGFFQIFTSETWGYHVLHLVYTLRYRSLFFITGKPWDGRNYHNGLYFNILVLYVRYIFLNLFYFLFKFIERPRKWFFYSHIVYIFRERNYELHTSSEN